MLFDSIDQDGQACTKALAATSKFSRNAHSQVLFEVAPGDYVQITDSNMFRSILSTLPSELLNEFEGLTADGLWSFVRANKFLLPRTGGKPA